jgi:hypothetical protein
VEKGSGLPSIVSIRLIRIILNQVIAGWLNLFSAILQQSAQPSFQLNAKVIACAIVSMCHTVFKDATLALA